MTSSRGLCGAIFAVSTAVSTVAFAGPPTYSLREVFTFDPPNQPAIESHANAISNNGWVAADHGFGVGGLQAWRCSPTGECREAPVQAGGHHGSVAANGINNDGVLVGGKPYDAPYGRGFKWDGVTVTYFDPFFDECPGCFLSTSAQAINNKGDIAGSGQGKGLASYAVLFGRDGTTQKLPTEGEARGITNDGFTVGTARHADGTSTAFTYDGTQLTDLGTLGGASSDAYAVNAHRQVVGCSAVVSGGTQAFIYDQQVMKPIPRLGDSTSACAKSINRHGHVVGYEYVSPQSYGTLFFRGKIYDLTTRLQEADRANWKIVDARGINGKGQIAAVAEHRVYGSRRAVVLEPLE